MLETVGFDLRMILKVCYLGDEKKKQLSDKLIERKSYQLFLALMKLNEETILDCWYVTDLLKLFLYRGISCLIDWFGLVFRNVVCK